MQKYRIMHNKATTSSNFLLYPVISFLLMFGLLIAGCSDNENEEELPAPDVPDYSTIIVKDIQNMPKNFTFDRVEVKVTGLDWQVIETLIFPYENGNIFQHFGRSEAFKFYDVDGDAVTATAVVSTNGSGHGALAGFLVAHHADAVICGGIGGGAQSALTEAGIRFYGGVSGSADAAVQALLGGSLGYDPEARCDHHDHAHGAGHTCGEHGCGEHGCHS